MSVKDADCLGLPLISKTDAIVDWGKNLVFENKRMTIREVANILGIPFGSCGSMLKDIQNVHQISAKFVLFLLREF